MIRETDVDRDLDRAGLPTPVYDDAERCWVLDFGPNSPGHPIVTAESEERLNAFLNHLVAARRRQRLRQQRLLAALAMEARN